MAPKIKEKEELEIKLVKLIAKIGEYALERINSVAGIANIVGEVILFGVIIATLFKSLLDAVKEIFQLLFNMILALCDKTTQVQDSENILWVTVVCVFILLIEHIICVCFVGKNADLKKSNST